MEIKIHQVLDLLTSATEPVTPTVDRLESGNAEAEVKAIAVTFLATQEVVGKAIELGANLIISHEGIFYSHWDKRELLKADPVYLTKLKTIEDNSLAIFRFHDHIHKYRPDGITEGLVHALGWQAYEVKNHPHVCVLEIPEMSLEEVLSYVKARLDLKYVRFVGDLAKPCKRVGVLVGYRGSGDSAIPVFEEEKLDLVIYGEGPEWETPEYVRDAVQQGRQKALIVLGHAESEAPGMKNLVNWLTEEFPSLPVHYIPNKPVFQLF